LQMSRHYTTTEPQICILSFINVYLSINTSLLNKAPFFINICFCHIKPSLKDFFFKQTETGAEGWAPSIVFLSFWADCISQFLFRIGVLLFS
jgi:hypothetical protein